jgi:hypothetical protein
MQRNCSLLLYQRTTSRTMSSQKNESMNKSIMRYAPHSGTQHLPSLDYEMVDCMAIKWLMTSRKDEDMLLVSG